MPNLRRLPSAPREIRRARRGEFQDLPKAQKSADSGGGNPHFVLGGKSDFFGARSFSGDGTHRAQSSIWMPNASVRVK